jgi:murein DD-endopeptidase MepM/ murein hydrolase activator NlpD
VNATGWLVGLLVLLAAGVGGLAWFRLEGEGPAVLAPRELVVGAQGTAIPITASDPGSGLRGLRVVLTYADGERKLLDETYPGNLISGGVRRQNSVEVALRGDALRGVRGDAVLHVTARDWSWRDLGSGNETRVDVPVTVDLVPPRIEVETGLTYVEQGGAGAVAYRLSEPAASDGVRVGDHFFAGYPRPGAAAGERVALYAIPAEGPTQPVVVQARDVAGNEAESRWPVVVKERELPKANVTLSHDFLETVVPRLADGPPGPDLAADFDEINTKVRASSEARIRKALDESAPKPLFHGALHQQPNSKVTSRFGEQRSYFLDGRRISKATHYGYDLASFAAAPVLAAGAGRVAFAGELGIYGNCVLIDHGLGLATLYGHLSRLDVAAGDPVESGQRLGLSGATGLAGGDHLHFAVLVGGIYVDPLEWWDERWVQSHVGAVLEDEAH